MTVRVVIAHRSALVRDVLRLLGVAQDVLVVGEARHPAELVELCTGERPGVAVTEAEFDDGTAVEDILPALLATGARVIVICDDPSPERLTRILALGASGFLRSDAAPAAVVDAIAAVATGAAVLAPAATGAILEQWRHLREGGATAGAGLPDLTARETEVLAAMADGLATKAIALRLGMALKTVENHKTRIFDKLGVPSQAAAVTYAITQGLLTARAAAAPATATAASAPLASWLR
jgi:DNA-binding NarL/FixJ family response regulator